MPVRHGTSNARRFSCSRAQATVELALVLPVLLLIAAAICQVAVGLNCYLVITGASREGARRGAETGSVDDARAAAEHAAAGLPGDKARVEVAFPDGHRKGRPVEVTVEYRMPLLIPLLDRFLPAATFKRKTTMALEKGD